MANKRQRLTDEREGTLTVSSVAPTSIATEPLHTSSLPSATESIEQLPDASLMASEAEQSSPFPAGFSGMPQSSGVGHVMESTVINTLASAMLEVTETAGEAQTPDATPDQNVDSDISSDEEGDTLSAERVSMSQLDTEAGAKVKKTAAESRAGGSPVAVVLCPSLISILWLEMQEKLGKIELLEDVNARKTRYQTLKWAILRSVSATFPEQW